MRRTLSLSKETLRILDDDDLARVVGGAGNDPESANSGSNAKCPGKAKGHDKKKPSGN
jgi:hypothetical protein